MSLRQNASVLEYCRTSMSALSGCAAGILGLTGLQGFLFYFITAFLLSVSIYFQILGNILHVYVFHMIINLICTVFNGVTVGSNTDILVQRQDGLICL